MLYNEKPRTNANGAYVCATLLKWCNEHTRPAMIHFDGLPEEADSHGERFYDGGLFSSAAKAGRAVTTPMTMGPDDCGC
jgi:hypothetical protein